MSITIDTLTSEELFEEFLEAVYELITMDASDYADRCDFHAEWTAQACWERMSGYHKDIVFKYVPSIDTRISWGTLSKKRQKAFYTLFRNV